MLDDLSSRFATLFLASTAFAQGSGEVAITIDDPQHTHVHSAGATFEIEVTVSDPGIPGSRIYAGWVGARGEALTGAVELAPGTHLLESPLGDPGYYGLVFTSDDGAVAFPPQQPGFPSSEYGFAIVHKDVSHERTLDPDSWFGTVQTYLEDPYVRGGTKTLTWNTTSPEYWDDSIQAIRSAELIEYPLVINLDWDSKDTLPISATHLGRLGKKFKSYLSADPGVHVWELGLEENAGDNYDQPYYFQNFRAKSERVREIADVVAPEVRLVYNTRGFDYGEIEDLFASDALDYIDVYSIHPYRWTDFPTPETWLPAHLESTRAVMEAAGRGDMALWITEFGIPVRGNNDPDGFFGYPESGAEVPGASRDYAAQYIVKGHAIAYAGGVEKIFVYNYQNRGDQIDYAEHHFGMRSYTGDHQNLPGHPLPSYVAYVTLLDQLEEKHPPLMRESGSRAYAVDFRSRVGAADVIIAWAHTEGSEWVALSELRPRLAPEHVRGVVDLYGTPQPRPGHAIELTSRPVYLSVVQTGL